MFVHDYHFVVFNYFYVWPARSMFLRLLFCMLYFIVVFEKEAKRNTNARAALEMVSQLLYSSMFVIGFRSIKLSQLFASRRSVFAGTEPVVRIFRFEAI